MHRLTVALICGLLALWALPAHGQSYPSETIKINSRSAPLTGMGRGGGVGWGRGALPSDIGDYRSSSKSSSAVVTELVRTAVRSPGNISRRWRAAPPRRTAPK